MPKRLRRSFSWFVEFYWGSGIANDVPALTYFLVISIAPFGLGSAVLAATILQGILSPAELARELSRYLPPDVREQLVAMVTKTNRESLQLSALALIAMLWTTSGAIGVIERVLTRMLDRPRFPIVIGRLRNLLAGALLCMLVVFGIAAASLTAGVSGQLGPARSALFLVFHACGTTLLCALIYRHAPRGVLRWRAALSGAVPAGIVLQLIPLALGAYVGGVAGASSAQIFFLLAGVLSSFFLLAQALLIGAGLAARAEHRLEARALRPAAPGLRASGVRDHRARSAR